MVLHYNSSQDESVNICSMLEHLSIEKEELVEFTKKIVFLTLEKRGKYTEIKDKEP